VKVNYVPLPARPMVNLIVDAEGMEAGQLRTQLRQRLSKLDPDSVVRVQVRGELPEACRKVMSAPQLRALVPSSVNISMAIHWQVRPTGG